jgi:hypothetical protein
MHVSVRRCSENEKKNKKTKQYNAHTHTHRQLSYTTTANSLQSPLHPLPRMLTYADER